MDADDTDPRRAIEAAEVVLPCDELDPTLAFFTERLGFRLDMISPADAPVTAVISGHGVRLRLERAAATAPGELVLRVGEPAALLDGTSEVVAPNGTRIRVVDASPALVVPDVEPAFVVSRAGDDATWSTGRAGMLYRDLLPGRLGGRFIASHIRIPDGGPVPDHAHHHRVRFQMIHCVAGWVRVVYQEQGAPIVLRAGDGVLQPPGIRHRVLECSPGLEVVEVTCPAEHETFLDHELTLPSSTLRPDREFAGQRFVHYQVESAEWGPWRLVGYEARSFGFAAATGGLAEGRVVRRVDPTSEADMRREGDPLFVFVVNGALTLRAEGHGEHAIARGDSCVVPAGLPHALVESSDDLELLEVTLPA